MNVPTNSTGWAELNNGTLVRAAFVLYDTYLQGWLIGILFMVFLLILMVKTRNIPAAIISIGVFMTLYIFNLKAQIASIAILLMAVLVAGIFYLIIFKDR